MKNFNEWLLENHPEVIEENWRRTVGALALAGSSFLPTLNIQAATPNSTVGSVDRELDQRLQGKYPALGGGRTDSLGESDFKKFNLKDWLVASSNKENPIVRQTAQEMAKRHGIIVDGHGYFTLTNESGSVKIKGIFLKIEKGFVHIRSDDGTKPKLPYSWLSPESQQLVNKIASAYDQ